MISYSITFQIEALWRKYLIHPSDCQQPALLINRKKDKSTEAKQSHL
jgi:hypothetical protein